MKYFVRLTSFCSLLLALCAGAHAQDAAAKADLRTAFSEGCARAKQLPGIGTAVCDPAGVERRHVAGDVFEYSFSLKVGAGEHDVIRLHRVVREKAPGVAAHTKRAVFMVHGDLWGFDGAFLSSTLSGNVPRAQSIGVYLAANGVDVWGIDLRWQQVPADTADLGFMKDWDIATHVRDIGAGLGVARTVRGFTGSGFGKLALLGWSRGGILAYAYANEETRLPEHLRQVSGLIPVDIAYKFNPEHEAQRAGACTRYAADRQLFDSGLYYSNQGVGVATFGLLAATSPNDPSPVPGFAGLTNSQVALLVASATHLLFAPNPPVPFYHFNAGTFDQNGLPSGLQFTREAYLYDFLQTAAPFQSFSEQMESEAIFCDELDVPYDDHLGEITLPVFYVGAEGGFGQYGLDTLGRLGSSDVSSHVVQLQAAEARAVEFGHADLFLADNAQELVWKPIYNWLVNH